MHIISAAVVLAALFNAVNAISIAEKLSKTAGSLICSDGSPGVLLSSKMHEGDAMSFWSCPATPPSQLNATPAWRVDLHIRSESPRAIDETALTKRDNLCGAPCTTHCFTPGGPGPNNFDCQALGRGIVKEGGNVHVDPGFELNVTFRSCRLQQSNYRKDTIQYCKSDLGAIIKYIGNHCQAKQNAQGGYCLFNNDLSTSVIQVHHS